MATYITRRLLMMIPTLIGITFLIFMLIALSPGGIGAALRASGGSVSAEGGGSRAQQEAYLEDRYGLDSPPPVQYIRWLARISPIKFGTRSQELPNGEVIASPRDIRQPHMWEWFAEKLPVGEATPLKLEGELTEDKRLRIYSDAAADYARARFRFVGEQAELLQALGRYAKATGQGGLVDYRGNPDLGELVRSKDDSSAWPELKIQGDKTLAAYAAAVAARATLDKVFDAKLFTQVGVPIIPSVVSVAWPDLGNSMTRGQPVINLITTALPVTLLLNLIAFPIIYFIAIPCGMLAAVKQGRWQDVAMGSLIVALWSVPTVWAGVMCLGYLASNQYLGLFPVGGLHDNASATFRFLPGFDADGDFARGYLLDTLWHIALPVLCLVYGGFAVLSKQTRAAMLENFSADYVRTAKAKGVAPRNIIVKHVLRNSLLPLITMFASVFPAMLAGSVVIERIFSIPGMGSMVIESIYLRDREVLLANTLMIAAVNLLALLLADILYALADPRISYK